AQSAGVNVSATSPDSTTAMTIVIANCLKKAPVTPPMKATGTNTEHNTSPNSVSTLIDIPKAYSPRNVPITLTGTASIGISVARQLCRKRNTTSVTSTIASTSVIVTSLIEALTNGVVSNGIA